MFIERWKASQKRWKIRRRFDVQRRHFEVDNSTLFDVQIVTNSTLYNEVLQLIKFPMGYLYSFARIMKINAPYSNF